MISRTTLMSTSTPAPVASICSGQTELDASSAGAAAVARTASVTSGGCSAAAALADTPAVAPKFNDMLSAVVCSPASSLVDGGSPFEREGDVETFATDSLVAASARVSELSCGVDVADSSRFGDSACRTFKPWGPSADYSWRRGFFGGERGLKRPAHV